MKKNTIYTLIKKINYHFLLSLLLNLFKYRLAFLSRHSCKSKKIIQEHLGQYCIYPASSPTYSLFFAKQMQLCIKSNNSATVQTRI